MDDVNVVTLGGRLGRDVEFRHMAQRTSYGVFSLCTSRYIGRDSETKEAKHAVVWTECQIDGRYGESIQNMLEQGAHVQVTGELRSFQTEEGKKKGLPPATYIWVHKVYFSPRDRRPESKGAAPVNDAAAPLPAEQPAPARRATTQVDAGLGDDDDYFASGQS